MGRGSVEAMLAALEQYLGGGEAAGLDRTPAQAYVAGVRHGYELATTGGELEAAEDKGDAVPLGFGVPPLVPPPNIPRGLRTTNPDPVSSVASLVDPRSTPRANCERGETLELFPTREAPRRRRRAFPEAFRLTPELRRFAEAGGLEAEQEFAAFRDHYRGTGEVRADWPASFREWCRRALAFRERERRRR